MKHCLYLFLYMGARQCYGRGKRGLELGLYNLRGLLGIRRLNRVLNELIRELCRVMKGVDERINEDVLQ